MKKLILLLFIPLVFTCSSDDNNSATQGCTDPFAVNFIPSAEEDDGSCLYSIIGDWEIINYNLSESGDILAAYNYLFWTIYADGSTLFEGELNNSELILVIGDYQISGENNSILTLTNEFGDVTVWTIIEISSDYIRLFSNNVLGQEALIEAIRI
jgi:hypothetical protein